MTKYTTSKICALAFIWTVSIIFPLILAAYIPFFDLKEKIFPRADARIKFSDIYYGSDSRDVPVTVFSGPTMIVDDLDLELKFRITNFTLYANIFKTAPLNYGALLEVYRSHQGNINLALIYAMNNETKVIHIDGNIQINREYVFRLKTNNTNRIYAYLDNKIAGMGNFNNMVFSEFILGNGLDGTRTFIGQIYLDHCFVSKVSIGKWFLRLLKSRSAYLVYRSLVLLVILLYSILIFYFVYYEGMESNEKEHLLQSNADTERRDVS